MNFAGRDLLSISDLTRMELLAILQLSDQMKKSPPEAFLKGKIVASCFFEPSTRTRLSFEAAAYRLGASVIGFADKEATSLKKGESLHDTMKVIGQYADLIVIRHPEAGSAHVAAQATDKPVINAGDGPAEHPTQSLLDLFTIQEQCGRLEGLSIAFVGDMKYGRAAHSLMHALKHFGCRLFFVSPDSLMLPKNMQDELSADGIAYSMHTSMEEIIGHIDVLYMTRIQQERFPSREAYEAVKDSFRLTPDMILRGKTNLKVLHPLPRVNEIAVECDAMPQSCYFEQAASGLYVRQALLTLMLGIKT